MNYAGITVGPIVDTMMMTSTPCGLWCASYFFSMMTHHLCKGLSDKGADIFTLPEGHDLDASMNGIGTYHDRIYFRSDKSAEETAALIDACVGETIKALAGEIDEALGETTAEQSLHDFIQFHYAIFPEDGIDKEKGLAKTLADALDALELAEKTKTEQKTNLLRRLIRGTQDDSNTYLKRYEPLKRLAAKGNFALTRGAGTEAIRDLASIARGTSEGKAGNYFAIVQCDGDNMGKVIGGTKKDASLDEQTKRIRNFSDFCMGYTTEAAQKVADYGGTVIYAGGDDLLFLAPIYGKAGKDDKDAKGRRNIWKLCEEIGETFEACFRNSAFASEEFEQKPSVSIGVSINYTSFPLYEAFADARSLLFGEAKEFGAKNNIAVKLRKHSGQAVGFVCRMGSGDKENGVYDVFLDFLRDFVDNTSDKEQEEENKLIHSVLYHLENQWSLFGVATDNCGEDGGSAVRNAFRNVFDNPGQVDAKRQNERLAELAIAVAKSFSAKQAKSLGTVDTAAQRQACADDAEEAKKQAERRDRLRALTSMIRTIKFLTEKEG